ncbi:MAG: hypothetical protein LBR19_04150 [Bifidobacteriaceae bacterium]|jgi:antitoxin component of RelBE/YafQ-DinJ toxin-antitoxin module|nr:hypothetical protein [Bifidobacteriaceae bacterium]
MTQTTLTIRIDSAVKAAAKSRAEDLGLTLSAVIANQLRRFINGAPIIVDDGSLVPLPKYQAVRTQALAEYRAGQAVPLTDAASIAAYEPAAHG